MEKTADVIIIGGGIMGCAAAYYLALEGVKALVLDKSDIGYGASSRNGGGVRQSARDVRELPLAMYGIKNLWPTLSEELGVDVEYCQKGNLRLGKTEEHLKILNKLADNSRAAGLDVKMVSGEEAREICPYMSEEVIGASWCPTDGHANPLMATLGYYKRARELGAHFITGVTVLGLKKIKGQLRCVMTDEGIFEAEHIIVAAGYESRAILNTVGIDVPMQKVYDECLVTEVQPKMFEQMLGTAAADFYGHQTKHGSFVFGGHSGMEAFRNIIEPPQNSSVTTACICRGIMKYFPVLEHTKIVRSWAGWLDTCVDKVPVISKVDEIPGLYIACAFTGHGFGIAPTVGKILSEMVTGKDLCVDISPLRYDRFKAKA